MYEGTLTPHLIKQVIDDLANNGVEYVVGLYTYLCSYSDYSEDNVIKTLEPAFGKRKAKEVYRAIKEKLSNIEISISKDKLYDTVKDILEKQSKIIQDEIKKRIKEYPKDKKALSVACAIIKSIKGKKYPILNVEVSKHGFIKVSYSGKESFSDIVSSILEKNLKKDARTLFYEYLLGYQSDSKSQYIFTIYPFANEYIERLAKQASNYIKIPKKSEITNRLKELYNNKKFFELSAIEYALSTDDRESKLKFFSDFFGITPEQLRTITIEGIMNKGYINPLVYGYVKEVMVTLEKEALKELKGLFKNVFEKAGYECYEGDKYCIFSRSLEKSIYVFFSAWPKYISDRPNMPRSSIKAVIIQGIPSESILNYLEEYEVDKEFVWMFLDREKTNIIIASNTYRSGLHEILKKILENNFSIKPLGPMPYIDKKLSKDILEAAVASVLKDLGFSVKVGNKFTTKAGTEIEIDVRGEKNIGNTKFIVYASCKNLDDPVKIDVIREEKGRVDLMDPEPHLKIIVAKLLTDEAKKEADFYRFLVIEIGEKINEENAEKAYWKVYKILSKLFAKIDA